VHLNKLGKKNENNEEINIKDRLKDRSSLGITEYF
jgi:hypothetical protein